MYEEERAKLEKEIDELSPKLESLESQMQERVKKLRDYQVAHYRNKLGFNKSKYHADSHFPKDLMGYPDKHIHRRIFSGKVKFFLDKLGMLKGGSYETNNKGVKDN